MTKAEHLADSARTVDCSFHPPPSILPLFLFAGDVETQLKQLHNSAQLQGFSESRGALAGTPFRPAYHFASPQGRLHDPNGLCYWQGRWHLFYQAFPPEDPRQHWGHAVSDDLLHWRDLPYAIHPGPERCCYSGATLVESDRVIAIYHGTEAGTMVATASDPLLLNWTKLRENPVIPMPKPENPPPPFTIFDPCIWRHDGKYFALTGGRLPHGPGGTAQRAFFLHTSTDLVKWRYLHPFVEDDAFGRVGDDGGCPYFWPLGDRYLLLHFSHIRGAQYLLGDYDTRRQKFIVTHGGSFNFGSVVPGGVHAPTATPDGRGGIITLFNMKSAKPYEGCNQLMTLPRRLTLSGRDRLCIEPAADTSPLRSEAVSIEPQTLPANRDIILDSVRGSALELNLEFDLAGVNLLEISVLRSPGAEETTRILFLHGTGPARRDFIGSPITTDSAITIDGTRASLDPETLSRPPETAPVELEPGDPLRLQIFVDRSVVEVFVNRCQCIAARVYPTRQDSTGVSIRAHGRPARLLGGGAWVLARPDGRF